VSRVVSKLFDSVIHGDDGTSGMPAACPFGPGLPAVAGGEPVGPCGLLGDIRGIASRQSSRLSLSKSALSRSPGPRSSVMSSASWAARGMRELSATGCGGVLLRRLG
jgi:hypothetical protein